MDNNELYSTNKLRLSALALRAAEAIQRNGESIPQAINRFLETHAALVLELMAAREYIEIAQLAGTDGLGRVDNIERYYRALGNYLDHRVKDNRVQQETHQSVLNPAKPEFDELAVRLRSYKDQTMMISLKGEPFTDVCVFRPAEERTVETDLVDQKYARLFAASPRLLAACQKALHCLQTTQNGLQHDAERELEEAIRDAIG